MDDNNQFADLVRALANGGQKANDDRWRDMVYNAAGGGSFGSAAASAAGDPNAARSMQIANQASDFFRSPNQLPVNDPRWTMGSAPGGWQTMTHTPQQQFHQPIPQQPQQPQQGMPNPYSMASLLKLFGY